MKIDVLTCYYSVLWLFYIKIIFDLCCGNIPDQANCYNYSLCVSEKERVTLLTGVDDDLGCPN